MSDSVDQERHEMAIENQLERTKLIRRQLDDVTRLWLEGLTVTLIAQRMCVQRDRVYFLLRVLELKPGKVKAKWRPGHLYGLKVPPVEDSRAA